MASDTRRGVGIVGFGLLGQFLYDHITTDPKVSCHLKVAFVWNRSVEKVPTSWNANSELTLPLRLIF